MAPHLSARGSDPAKVLACSQLLGIEPGSAATTIYPRPTLLGWPFFLPVPRVFAGFAGIALRTRARPRRAASLSGVSLFPISLSRPWSAPRPTSLRDKDLETGGCGRRLLQQRGLRCRREGLFRPSRPRSQLDAPDQPPGATNREKLEVPGLPVEWRGIPGANPRLCARRSGMARPSGPPPGHR